MIVKRTRVLGQCMGVKRAIAIALKTASNAKEKIHSWGPLIHNPEEVKILSQKGIVPIADIDEAVMGKTLVIRAHGIAPATKKALQDKGVRIADATCPRVLASQRLASRYATTGYTVIIAGDAGHGEVVSIAGHAPGSVVIGSVSEARKLATSLQNKKPLAIIAQTTISQDEYNAIISIIQEKTEDITVLNTICPCTKDRIDAVQQLSAQVSALLIIGGRNSANTNRLFQAAKETGKPAWLIENANEIPKAAFLFDTIGIGAGASTPDFLIDEVEEKLKNTH